jgi:hypothetical protein
MTTNQPERILHALLVVALSTLAFLSLGAPVGPPMGHAHELALPDGTFAEALNGAIDPAPLRQSWGTGPWSPIVGVERNSVGIDWYRHADGSYSTTERIWHGDKGEWTTMTRVAHHGSAVTQAAK